MTTTAERRVAEWKNLYEYGQVERRKLEEELAAAERRVADRDEMFQRQAAAVRHHTDRADALDGRAAEQTTKHEQLKRLYEQCAAQRKDWHGRARTAERRVAELEQHNAVSFDTWNKAYGLLYEWLTRAARERDSALSQTATLARDLAAAEQELAEANEVIEHWTEDRDKDVNFWSDAFLKLAKNDQTGLADSLAAARELAAAARAEASELRSALVHWGGVNTQEGTL